jgi:hypothetical protein
MTGPCFLVNVGLERVRAPAPAVRPWYAPWKVITYGRPVDCREILIAASMASVPRPCQRPGRPVEAIQAHPNSKSKSS